MEFLALAYCIRVWVALESGQDLRNKRKREQYAAGKARNTLERTLNTNTHVDDALTIPMPRFLLKLICLFALTPWRVTFLVYSRTISITMSRRLVVSMDVFDSTGRVTAGAIKLVAEEILQTTTADLSRLIKLGIRYDLNTIRAELENKEFLILLWRTYSWGTSRISRLLLVAFFDETVDGRANVANLSQTAPGNVSSPLSLECLAHPHEFAFLSKQIT
ncbi:hypothetical protein Leryth_013625 [Lithospermum erythrorhizon]|nr:hypothetical protein Leryth_013625 [Lithospermum erythrorhizon]